MYILFDIGGTKTRIAFSENGKLINKSESIETPQKFLDAVLMFKDLAFKLSGGKKIKKIAIGIAGPINNERTGVANAPNLPDWDFKDIKSYFEKAFSCEVMVENDAALGALGEAVYGEGRGYEVVGFLTVSTGIGGAKIANKKIAPSFQGFEPGHMIIDADRTLCPTCENPPYLENMCSGKSLIQRFKKPPKEIDNPRIWEELALWLAYGLNNAAVLWSPEIIILGGPMIFGAPAIPFESIEKHFKELMKVFPECPVLKIAKLKDEVGLWGGLALLNQ
ncbi:MAG: ROK family protein [Candidatus Pacebacteria bacterium]|nr:ROK family protein [Candidatus Paceibacterota bacterium]